MEDACAQAAVRASLDDALGDLLRDATQNPTEPDAVSCARIDAVLDRRMAPHQHLDWALAEAETLKRRLKAGLQAHALDAARQTHGAKRGNMGGGTPVTGTIIPLRSNRGATSEFDVVDVTAMMLLREGRAATLSGARLDAIRTDLLAKRVQLTAVIAELQARPASGDLRIDAVNATLRAEASTGLIYLDLFLEQLKTCASRVA